MGVARQLIAVFATAASLVWSSDGQAALLTYDYTARLVDEIGPYDANSLGNTASGHFTIDTAANGGGGFYSGATPLFTLNTTSGIAVSSSLDLQLIDSAPGAGQDALAGRSTAIAGSLPIADTSVKSLSFYWGDDSGTALHSTALTDLPPLTLATFTNAGLDGDYILFSFNDVFRSGAQGEYSLTSLTLRGAADTAAAVPEPASLVLLMTGLFGLAWARRAARR